MSANRIFTRDKANSAADDFDGEMIVIQFRNGTYSALTGSGNIILSLLEEPRTIEDIATIFTPPSDKDGDAILTAVSEFVARLEDLGIVVETPEAAIVPVTGDKQVFEVPGIDTFTDLADLMKIDPVHEVEVDEGWPHVANDTTDAVEKK